MFEIEVFSSPAAALSTDPGGWLAVKDFPLAAQYDEAIVRPAILLADRVHLVSQRIDRLESFHASMFASAMLGIPRATRAIGVSWRRSPEELEQLNLRDSDLIPPSELPDGIDFDWLEFSAKFKDEIFEINRAIHSAIRTMRESLGSSGLKKLEQADILISERWSTEDISPPISDWQTNTTEYIVGSLTDISRRMRESTSGIMVDFHLRPLLDREGADVSEWASEQELHGAADLMRMVSGFEAIPTDELIDVRTDLAEYLTPFRGFLLNVSRGLEKGVVTEAEHRRSLELAWQREVEPAISEMRALVTKSSFRRSLTDVFAPDIEAMVSLGMGVALTGSALYYGAAVAAPLTMAAPPAFKAIHTAVRAREKARESGVYFAYAFERRARRSKGRRG